MPSEGRAWFSAAVMLLAVLVPTSACADPLPGEDASGTKASAETPSEPVRPSSKGQPAGEPEKPFVPSESIPADSAVAFPVDI